MKRLLTAAFTALITVTGSAALAGTVSQPSNRVVVLVDASLSFASRRHAAIDATSALLDTMSSRRLHRWEVAHDTISVISLDALPEVIWQGTLPDLKRSTHVDWEARFTARTDFARCTDVGTGFRLAARLLQGDSRLVHKYLFVFSDLVDEPPMGSARTCRPARRPSLPPEGFPWGSLRDVSTSVFWVPVDQKLAWAAAVGEQGLDDTFHLYSTSESGSVTVVAPPIARVTTTDDDRAAAKAGFLRAGFGALRFAGTAMLGFGLLVALILVVARVTSRPRPSRRGARRRPAGARNP